MNEKWMKLIEECETNGYTPGEVQRILMYYEMTKDIDNKLKKLFEDEENEIKGFT
ncbi:hypothetical protein AB7942_29870 [Neobacillus sp. BF23-41]|uniref:hypothetical protein n=1 Tax=Neobacillus sp. BF23-41 TaxID=3240280 RepID=UPI0034E4EC8C